MGGQFCHSVESQCVEFVFVGDQCSVCSRCGLRAKTVGMACFIGALDGRAGDTIDCFDMGFIEVRYA